MFKFKIRKLKRQVKNCEYCQTHYGWCEKCQRAIEEIENIVRKTHPIKL